MPDQVHQPGVQPDPSPSLSGIALSSLVCGVLGFFTVGFTGIIAVILGHIALSQIRRSGGVWKGRWLAIGGLVTGYLGVLLFLGLCFAIHTLQVGANEAKIRQVRSDFKSFESALGVYRLRAGGYPTSAQGLEALVEKPTLPPKPRRWTQVMSKLPVDTWDRAYDYRFPGRKNPNHLCRSRRHHRNFGRCEQPGPVITVFGGLLIYQT